MFFANLTLLELGALFAAAAGLTVALYLLSYSRRQVVVSTMRFWQAAKRAAERKRRRRIDEPWSLLMQLLALACLLLAVSQPRWGSPETTGRDHVLLMDTSAWMAARSARGPLEGEAERQALEWLATLPDEDRVMVVEAGPLASPKTAFEADREKVRRAIRAAAPGAGALDLEQAFGLAAQAQRLRSGRPGEIVYAGAGRVSEARPETIAAPGNLRVLPLPEVRQNAGLVRFWVSRAEDGTGWRAYVTARNDSPTRRAVPVVLAMGGAVAGTRMLDLAPGAEATAAFTLTTRAGAWVEARLGVRDSFPGDDRAVLELPAQPALRIAVYTEEPELLRPLLAADARNEARFLSPSQYRPDVDADLIVIDRFGPAAAPLKPALWIEPPAGSSPIPARRFAEAVALTGWNTRHALGSGLRARDLKLESGLLLEPADGDVMISEAGGKALMAARPGERKEAVLGYHPGRPALKYELSAPLLMAHLLEWFAPEIYLRREVLAGSPGAISVELDEYTDTEQVKVMDSEGKALPFTIDGRAVRFFTAETDTVRVIAGAAERTLSLSLPDAGRSKWTPGAGVKTGAGARQASAAGPRDLWPWFALAGAALLLIEWWIYGRKRARAGRERYVMAALKAAAVLVALAALMEPSIPVNETKMAVNVLVDTSSSIEGSDLGKATAVARSIQSSRGRHEVRVMGFARHLNPPAGALAEGMALPRSTGEAGRATNIESALTEAMTVLPPGLVPRMVVVSDGRETLGSAARAAYQARQLGIPVDTVVLPGRAEPKLKLASLRMPAVAFTGEKIPIEITVESPAAAKATIEILAEGKSIGQSPIELAAGTNSLRATGSIVTPGAISVTGILRAGELGELRFEQALSLRRPRALYMTQDAPGMDTHLMGVLNAAQYEVVAAADMGRAVLEDYQLAIFNNYDLETLPMATRIGLERFIQRGGGVLVIGGERNIYVDKKGKPADPLDLAMPATVAPPKSPEGTSVILIVDKSSSMEGRKMELARLAAIGVVENLRPIDYVGILIFDNSHQWAVPLRRAEDKNMIKRLIAGITPDGGTQIAPALAEAYKRMATATGAYKHIVLLTDGISEEGDSLTVAKDAAERRVTISTVGLGQDVNRTYLEKVAVAAKGKSYFLTDPSNLEQILIKDVMEHTGSTTVEKTLELKVIQKAEVFRDVALETAPALKGYVRFDAKKDADILLAVPGEERKDDPLLVRWQYGLGRTAVFTSDAKARWAEGWIGWKGYDKFWANVLRDLLPHAQSGEATLVHDAVNGTLIAEYRLAAHLQAPAEPPTLYLLGPGGYQRPVTVERAGQGYYRAVAPIGARQGLFRLRPLAETAAFPETGVYIPEMELSTFGNNARLMRQMAEYTGGMFNPRPGDVFSTNGRSTPSMLRLWPGLLALALLLNLGEVAWRKLKRT